jgi:hypothetical protein
MGGRNTSSIISVNQRGSLKLPPATLVEIQFQLFGGSHPSMRDRSLSNKNPELKLRLGSWGEGGHFLFLLCCGLDKCSPKAPVFGQQPTMLLGGGRTSKS